MDARAAFALIVLLAVGVALVGTLAYVRLRVFGHEATTAAEWHRDAAALVGEVRGVAAAARSDRAWSRERRRPERLVPLAGRLEGLLRTAPPTVDAPLRRRLYDLSQDCREVGFECAGRRTRWTLETEEELDALAADAAALEQQLDGASEPSKTG